MIPLKDNIKARRWPFVNVLLLLTNVAVFVYQYIYLPQGPGDLIHTFGFTPRTMHLGLFNQTASGLVWPITLVTAMFLHGGWLHLIGNMLYLWIFGDNVEDRLGHLRYLVFYLFCGIGASMTHAAVFPESPVPVVGASGAIAGVLAGYMIAYPRARVTTLFFIFIFIRIVRIPAIILLGLWVAIQVFSGMTELSTSVGGVAWFAHIGGFGCGLVLMLLLGFGRRRGG